MNLGYFMSFTCVHLNKCSCPFSSLSFRFYSHIINIFNDLCWPQVFMIIQIDIWIIIFLITNLSSHILTFLTFVFTFNLIDYCCIDDLNFGLFNMLLIHHQTILFILVTALITCQICLSLSFCCHFLVHFWILRPLIVDIILLLILKHCWTLQPVSFC